MGAQCIFGCSEVETLGGEGWGPTEMGCKEFSRSRRAACDASAMQATKRNSFLYIASIFNAQTTMYSPSFFSCLITSVNLKPPLRRTMLMPCPPGEGGFALHTFSKSSKQDWLL